MRHSRGKWAGPTRSSASTMPAASPCASGSTPLLDQNSFHEIGAIAGRGRYGDNGELEALQPANFVFGRGRIDGRDGRGRRRRLHGARRRRGRRDLAEAGDVRADGERAAPAARPPDRRHRRRRLGQDHREPRLHLCAGEPRLESRGRQHGRGAGRGAGLGLGCGARRRAACVEPLFADGRGHLAHVHCRAAGGGAQRQGRHQGRARRQRHSRAGGRGR